MTSPGADFLGLLLGTALPADPTWCSAREKENREELRSREEGGEERKKDRVLLLGIDQINLFIIFSHPFASRLHRLGKLVIEKRGAALPCFCSS
jgi:hypothetical protein